MTSTISVHWPHEPTREHISLKKYRILHGRPALVRSETQSNDWLKTKPIRFKINGHFILSMCMFLSASSDIFYHKHVLKQTKKNIVTCIFSRTLFFSRTFNTANYCLFKNSISHYTDIRKHPRELYSWKAFKERHEICDPKTNSLATLRMWWAHHMITIFVTLVADVFMGSTSMLGRHDSPHRSPTLSSEAVEQHAEVELVYLQHSVLRILGIPIGNKGSAVFNNRVLCRCSHLLFHSPLSA